MVRARVAGRAGGGRGSAGDFRAGDAGRRRRNIHFGAPAPRQRASRMVGDCAGSLRPLQSACRIDDRQRGPRSWLGGPRAGLDREAAEGSVPSRCGAGCRLVRWPRIGDEVHRFLRGYGECRPVRPQRPRPPHAWRIRSLCPRRWDRRGPRLCAECNPHRLPGPHDSRPRAGEEARGGLHAGRAQRCRLLQSVTGLSDAPIDLLHRWETHDRKVESRSAKRRVRRLRVLVVGCLGCTAPLLLPQRRPADHSGGAREP